MKIVWLAYLRRNPGRPGGRTTGRPVHGNGPTRTSGRTCSSALLLPTATQAICCSRPIRRCFEFAVTIVSTWPRTSRRPVLLMSDLDFGMNELGWCLA